MKKTFVILIISAFLPLATGLAYSATIPATGTVEVFFSPRGGATEAITREIASAQREILIQAYGFTSIPIAKALLESKKRGVKIEAVLDKSNATAKYSAATFLFNAGIPVLIDSSHAIAHNKVMIIDRQTLITGSFNFTRAAEEKNAENLLILRGNKPLIEKYFDNYEAHKGHSTLYQR